ncbi:MAG: beta-lactamase family protein [Chloroflexi bacterium]|nr:beta-lactamase family protein [Chloroflexota bacterium]
MTTALEVHGTCDSRFNSVKDIFARNFDDFGEVGASVAVIIDGEPVVDLWAGHADAARTRPWERDTIANVYSSTKGMVATCIARLIGEGRLDVDEPVASYWPEFAQAGKQDISVRLLLSHQAGLPALDNVLPAGAIFNWDVVTNALAKQKPWWEPGTKHGYHAVTYGFLAGELIRRITEKSVGTYFRDEIASPLGIDFHIGLPEEHDPRVAEIIPPPLSDAAGDSALAAALRDPTSMTFKAFLLSPDMMIPNLVNTRQWRAAEIPAANGHGNARSLAGVYAALARGGELNGVRVATSPAIERASREEAIGDDAVMPGWPLRVGLGFKRSISDWQLGPNPRSFGHGGMGGSIGFADPDARVGFSYVMNKMISSDALVDPRWPRLVRALYDSI